MYYKDIRTIIFLVLSISMVRNNKGSIIKGGRVKEDVNTEGLRLACWNSRGIVAALPYLNKLMERCDVIAIAEHWLHENRLNVLMDVSKDFNMIARASKFADAGSYGSSRGQGGVALLWRKSLSNVTPISKITHDRVCGIRVPIHDGRILCIYSIYLPSQGSIDDFSTTVDEIYDIVYSDSPSNLCVMCGDFNGDVGYLGGRKSSRQPTNQGKKVADLMSELNLYPVNLDRISEGPINTFKGGMGSSTLDYIAIPTCMRDKVTSCRVVDDAILNSSDHLSVEATLGIKCSRDLSYKIPKKGRILWGKAQKQGKIQLYHNKVKDTINGINERWQVETVGADEMDGIFDVLTKGLIEADKIIPRSKPKTRPRPFWNQTLSILKREKVTAYREWKAAGSPRTLSDRTWVNHKNAKKSFRREIKKVQRDHEQKEISNLVEAAGIDKNKFWRLLKRKRNQTQSESFAINSNDGSTKYDIHEVVKVWKDHFSNLCAPDMNKVSDLVHHQMVSDSVKDWYAQNDDGFAFREPLTYNEMSKAIQYLNSGKSPGYDEVTAEHLKLAGEELIEVLTRLFNQILNIEHIPKNFRIGTQVPIYKGKNLCSLDPNNYRGITLLTSFNKLFEICTWNRLKVWWEVENVISPLQGACSKGSSCLHTAIILQEAIAVGLDTNKRVFVAYFDVAKAFDSVWIDGLFYQLRGMGLIGKEWRLLYQTYLDFWCKARMHGIYSDWYPMRCGIHQGGYLSLLKYAAFIDPLLRKLEDKSLGFSIAGVPTCPLGYADDMAAACMSRTKLDEALRTANNFSVQWEYQYNAKKSAVMIYGENMKEHKKGKRFRNFMLGRDKVQETVEYDHVGVKNCLFGNFNPRVEDRISRGRRAFNSILNSGVKRNGLNMSVVSTLFWTIVIPIVSYGSEVWVLKGDEIELLKKFQRYVGRKSQRFNQRSPNYSAYMPLGWISLEKVVYIKKLLFLRSICVMDDEATCKKILISRTNNFIEDCHRSKINVCDSPIYEMFNVAERLGMLDMCLNMTLNGHYYDKKMWSKCVWENAWNLEDEEITLYKNQLAKEKLIFQIIEKPYYLTWWVISDVSHEHMKQCEVMARLVCDTSLLKTTDIRMKKASLASRFCEKCDLGSEENIKHIVMECPFFEGYKEQMFDEIRERCIPEVGELLNRPAEIFLLLMGRQPDDVSFEAMFTLWTISAKHISNMYARVIYGR